LKSPTFAWHVLILTWVLIKFRETTIKVHECSN